MILLEATPLVETLPVWVWFCGLVVTSLIGPAVVAWINNKKIRAEAESTRVDVAEIKEQVKNTHESNLRADMDETRGVATESKEEATEAKESSHRTERLVKDLMTSLRAIEHSMDRRDKLQTKALGEVSEDLTAHLKEVPSILEDAFKRHAADCPIRTPQPPTKG